jgi:hypothetical protein
VENGHARKEPGETDVAPRPEGAPAAAAWLVPLEVRAWRELGAAVDERGTFQTSDPLAFQLILTTEAAEEPGDLAPAALAHVRQAAGSMRATSGLGPQSRERVKRLVDERTRTEPILAIMDGGHT